MGNIPDVNLSGSDDDEIYRVKTFISELTLIQNNYFECLLEKLKLNDSKCDDWMFDYIFNSISDLSFGEYLDTFNTQKL